MLRIRANEFVSTTALLQSLRTMIEGADFAEANSPISERLKDVYTEALNGLLESIKPLNLPLTELCINRTLESLRADHHVLADFRSQFYEIENRIFDELRLLRLYLVDAKNADLIEPTSPPFGEEVHNKFPKITYDVEEAGICLALKRSTACVLHLMRVMEATVQAMCAHVGISNVQRTWGILLSDIHAKIEQMPKGADRDAWSEAHVNLYHVKQAWRNNTMHPNRTYTEEQAEEIYLTVKAFVRQLSELV